VIENRVKRADVPDAACQDCGMSLREATAYATYKRDGARLYKCGACYEADPILRQRTEVYSRVCGYLRPVEQWNVAKQQEFRDRAVYRA